MPRIRTLKPEHRTHRKIGPLDHITYRLWVGMILEADDAGRLVCDTEQLRVTIFGYHPKVSRAVIEASLSRLDQCGLLTVYATEAQRYACFPSWKDHQKIDHPTDSKLPPFNDSLVPREDSPSAREDSRLSARAGADRKGSDLTGSEGKGSLVVMSDDQFLASLRLNPAYTGIDLDRELGRMDAWLSTPKAKGRKKTRQFIVNWLNRIDRPVEPDQPVMNPRTLAAGRRFIARHEGDPT